MDFLWEGCDCLITEDNKLMLGWNYVDYDFGPNVVPMMDEQSGSPTERVAFERQALMLARKRKY